MEAICQRKSLDFELREVEAFRVAWQKYGRKYGKGEKKIRGFTSDMVNVPLFTKVLAPSQVVVENFFQTRVGPDRSDMIDD